MAKYAADNYKNSGMSKGAYEKSQGKSSSSSDQKKATSKISSYYKKKSSTAKDQAKTDIERLQEDLNYIYEQAGISKTRAIEDYNTNIANLEANKASDVASLNDYVSTTTTRTAEDLDTSIAKEARRYSLEYDQINQDLADKGLTFSERTPEKIAEETSLLNKQAIAKESRRSFQDIARYEAAKTRELELSYGQKTEVAETTKTRTLEDIANDITRKTQLNTRGVEDVNTNLKNTLTDISYGKDTDIATISQMYEQNALSNKLNQETFNAIG